MVLRSPSEELGLPIMPIGLPIKFWAGSADDLVVAGSIRQRSAGSFELRVFIEIDPDTHRRRYRSTTVRANRAEAERELAAMVAAVRAEREVGARSTVGELLEA